MDTAKKDYHLTDLVVIFLVFMGLQIVIFFILNQLLSLIGLASLGLSLSTVASFGLIILWQKKVHNLNLQVYFTNPSISFFQVVGLILAASGLSIILSEVNNIMHSFFPLSEELISQMNEVFSLQNNLVLPTLGVTIITVILKELLFRGLILQGLIKNYSLSKAVGFTILIQLIMEFNFYHLIGIFTISLLLNWFYLHYKSLLTCILGSLFYYLIPYLSIYFLPYKIPGYNTELTTTAQFQPLWFNLLGILAFALGSYIILNTSSLQKNS